MDSSLTRAQQYIILCIGPQVERLVLPLIIKKACEEHQPLQEFFTPASKTFNFIRNAEEPLFDDDTYDIKNWAGIINRWSQLSTGAFIIEAGIDCYDVDWTFRRCFEIGGCSVS